MYQAIFPGPGGGLYRGKEIFQVPDKLGRRP